MKKYIQFNTSGQLIARYAEDFHGMHNLDIPDPTWIHPTIQVAQDDGNGGTVIVEVPNESIEHPTITVPNPDCKIPADAVEVSDELFFQTINETDGVWKLDPSTGDIVKYPLPPPSLDSVKTDKTTEINAACAASIVGGFTSSALGAPHTYDSALEDQLNLIGAVGLGVDLPYRCADASGAKAFRMHTAAQLKQVAADGAAIKLAALEKAATLKAQVQAATDAAAVEAVVW